MLFSKTIPLRVTVPGTSQTRQLNNITYITRDDRPYTDERTLDVYSGLPQRVVEANDVFMVNGAACLYDRSGERIADSCIRRRSDLSHYVRAGEAWVKPPSEYMVVDKPIVFLTWLQNHWGHFLSEGVSRLWAMGEYPELAQYIGLFTAADGIHKNISDLLKLTGHNFYIAEGKRHVPILFRKAFIPDPSFANQAFAFTGHRHIVSQALANLAQFPQSPGSNQPVYLSRSQLNACRVIENELDLERQLVAIGVRIVHPESLSLFQQIRLFSEHRHIVGCWGSAFFSTMFAKDQHALTTYTLCEERPHANSLLLDAILGHESNYLQLLSYASKDNRRWPHLKLTVCLDEVLKHFKSIFL